MNHTTELPFTYIANTLAKEGLHADWEWTTTHSVLHEIPTLEATYPGLASCRIQITGNNKRLRQKDIILRVALSRHLTETTYNTNSRIQVSLEQSLKYKRAHVRVWHVYPFDLPALPPTAFTNEELSTDFTNNIVSILNASNGLHNQIDHRLKSIRSLPTLEASPDTMRVSSRRYLHDDMRVSPRRYELFDTREFIFTEGMLGNLY